MNLYIDEKALIAEAIAKLLPPSKLEDMARAEIKKRFQLMTAKQVAERLNINVKSVYKLKIPHYSFGEATVRYHEADVEALIEKRRVPSR